MTSYIGTGVDRVDGPAKTTGKAQFAAKFPYDGIAHAALTYATVTRGRIIAIDTAAACAIPGVIAVFTHLNAPTNAAATQAEPDKSGKPGEWHLRQLPEHRRSALERSTDRGHCC